MSRSDERQFQLGPLRVESGIRYRTLEEVVSPEMVAPGPIAVIEPPVGPAGDEQHSPVPDELLVWEFEGGNLGRVG